MMERRHPETHHIDTLATLDMLTLLHKDNRQIADAVGPVCRRLPVSLIMPPQP
jgi:N-acetylmuramic acid 6-phosphate (MurNAc-6-P) etherase